MTTTTETPTTDEVLVGMLTENTGRHFLDSGSAYGRNWERNQGSTVEDWKARPAATLDKYGCLTVDVFHFLSDRLDFDPDLDALFTEFAQLPENEDAYWLTLMDGFPAWLAENHGDEYGGTEASTCTVNTYNGEDALSQVLQYTLFTLDGRGDAVFGEYVLLQIHGGCDVRGGYTAPRVFRTGDCALFDNARATLYCTAPRDPNTLPGMPEPAPHAWSTDNAGYRWERWSDGREDDRLDDLTPDEDGVFHCPECNAPLDVEAWPAG